MRLNINNKMYNKCYIVNLYTQLISYPILGGLGLKLLEMVPHQGHFKWMAALDMELCVICNINDVKQIFDFSDPPFPLCHTTMAGWFTTSSIVSQITYPHPQIVWRHLWSLPYLAATDVAIAEDEGEEEEPAEDGLPTVARMNEAEWVGRE